jgi:hypothetical protein
MSVRSHAPAWGSKAVALALTLALVLRMALVVSQNSAEAQKNQGANSSPSRVRER